VQIQLIRWFDSVSHITHLHPGLYEKYSITVSNAAMHFWDFLLGGRPSLPSPIVPIHGILSLLKANPML